MQPGRRLRTRSARCIRNDIVNSLNCDKLTRTVHYIRKQIAIFNINIHNKLIVKILLDHYSVVGQLSVLTFVSVSSSGVSTSICSHSLSERRAKH